MRKRFIQMPMILMFLSLLSACKSQELPSTNKNPIVDIEVQAQILKVDKLGHIYLVTSQNELVKYDGKGKVLKNYSNDVLGQLMLLDVTNPLKLILFYPDHQMVLSLDNALSEIGRYDLQELGFNEILAVAMSNDNQLWLYDPESFSLKKINNKGDVIAESYSLVSENLGLIRPTSIKERHNKVYLNDPEMGIVTFDNYGQFIKLIPIRGALEFQIESGGLIYFDGKEMYQYDSFLFESHRLNVSENSLHNAKTALLRKEKLYILLKEGVKIENRGQ